MRRGVTAAYPSGVGWSATLSVSRTDRGTVGIVRDRGWHAGAAPIERADRGRLIIDWLSMLCGRRRNLGLVYESRGLGDFRRRRLHKRVCERRKRMLRLSQGFGQSKKELCGPGQRESRVLQVRGRKRYFESSPSKTRSESAIANVKWRGWSTLHTVAIREINIQLNCCLHWLSHHRLASSSTSLLPPDPPSISHVLKRTLNNICTAG